MNKQYTLGEYLKGMAILFGPLGIVVKELIEKRSTK